MISFTVQKKKVDVYPAAEPDSPVIYLHTFGREGGKVYRALKETEGPDFSLVAVSGLDWDADMTPWDCPPISKVDSPCTGGADAYLKILTEEIVPRAESHLSGKPVWRGLAGYSLAGLFAVYAVYRTDVFSRVASMSGSLWFPDFLEYVTSHEMKIRPDRVFFSLGDKEAKTRNTFLKPVQENTAAIQAFYAEQGLDTVFHLNSGGHYVDGAERTAAGIAWILKDTEGD